MKHSLIVFFLFTSIMAAAQIDLEFVVDGLDAPVAIENAGDDRIFIVERNGVIKILHPNGELTNFLNIEVLINTSFSNERGLLGLAFHPNYASNGFFYVNYTGSGGDTRVSRFTVSADPDVADVTSEAILMIQDQPYANHNGGDLQFGPDGYLYIGFGDGGNFDDQDNFAQNLNTFLGKMLRIDVDNGSPYAVPGDNPFVGPDGILDEIWAIGLRNPWRYSFDALTGDLWIADVGQEIWEEINLQSSTSQGGENYGWRCYEGDAAFNTSGCSPIENYEFPVYDYSHSNNNCSVTGGFVYRGSEMPEHYGKYFFCDYCTGTFWTLIEDGGDYVVEEVQAASGIGWSTFGQDYQNELYVGRIETGAIYKIVSECANFEASFTVNNNELTASEGEQFQWFLNGVEIPGATDQVYIATQSGAYSVLIINSEGCEDISDIVGVVVSSIFDLEIIDNLKIYPNPFFDELSIDVIFNQRTDFQISIINGIGQLVWKRELKNVSQIEQDLDLSDFEAGIYNIRLEIEGEYIQETVVKH